MRVAIFTDNDFDKVNGVTTTLQAVLRYAPDGIEPRIYTASSTAADRPNYFAPPSFGVPIPFYAEMRMYLPRLRRYLRQARLDRTDVIHLTTPGPIGLAGMRVARRLGIPMVGSFHTDLAAYTRILSGSRGLERLMRDFMKWPYGRCARVLVPSDATRRLLEPGADIDGPASRRVAIWQRGVDCEHFHPERRSAGLREQWRVSRGTPAVLYVGRVSKEKGLDLLPGVQERLRQWGVRHRFVIVGSGPMLPELKARMPDAVFTGSLDRDNVAVAFASADVFLFPSRTDTAGNVVLEAQASGVPVLVSEAGGPRENMSDGETGLVVGGADAVAWASALRDLLGDEGRLGAMARGARAYGQVRSWEAALEPLYRTYRELACLRASGSTPDETSRPGARRPQPAAGAIRPAMPAARGTAALHAPAAALHKLHRHPGGAP
jgi:glycosyltransferase involved in cell wall biosynthesis